MKDWFSNLATEESLKPAKFPDDIIQGLKRAVSRECSHIRAATSDSFNINESHCRAVIDITLQGMKYQVKTGFMPVDQVDKAIIGNVKTKA